MDVSSLSIQRATCNEPKPLSTGDFVMEIRFAIRALPALALLCVITTPAKAVVITETISFTATNFTDQFGASGSPFNPVTGSLTFTFDKDIDYPNNTPGVVVNSFSVPGFPTSATFSAVKATFMPATQIIIQTTFPAYFALNIASASPAVYAGSGGGSLGPLASFTYCLTGTCYTSQTGSYQVNAAAVPEPAVWALMIGGFGMVGSAMRTRSRKMPLATA